MKPRARTRARAKAALERAGVSALSALLVRLGKDIATRVRNGKEWQSALAATTPRLDKELSILMRRAAIAGASDTRASLPERKAAPEPAFVDQFTLNWIRRHSAKRVQQINKTTARAIRRQIIDGTRKGWSQDRIARAIERATEGEIGKVRARRIARTETHTAYERGSYEQAIALQKIGIEIVVEWGATEDDKTRPDHAAADGQVVDLGKTFTVGNEAMRFPGDPRASAKQICNCRCTALYYPKGTR